MHQLVLETARWLIAVFSVSIFAICIAATIHWGSVVANSEYLYLYQRAEAELEQAQRATHVKAASAHHQLVEIYLERAALLASGAQTKCDLP